MPFSKHLFHSYRRLIAAAVAGVLLVVGAIAYTSYQHRQDLERAERAREVAEEILEATEKRFEEIPALAGDELAELRTFRNEAHVELAESLGVTEIDERETAIRIARERGLVELEDTEYYTVRELDYSIPYVTESTANLLELIGMRFQQKLVEAGLPPYRFVITSVTRTLEDQQALTQVNINAATRSSHWFGTTVDLHYREFDYAGDPDVYPESDVLDAEVLNATLERGFQQYASAYPTRLKAILGRVLADLQEEGKVLTIYERRQPVYHITLAEEVPAPEPAADLTARAD